MIVEIRIELEVVGEMKEWIEVPKSNRATLQARAKKEYEERTVDWTRLTVALRDEIVKRTILKNKDGKVVRWFEGECVVGKHRVRLERPPNLSVIEVVSGESTKKPARRKRRTKKRGR